jgi:hypothetical protein
MGALNARPGARSGAGAHDSYFQIQPALPESPPLTRQEVSELVDYFTGYEASIGYRSSYSAMLAAATRAGGHCVMGDEEMVGRMSGSLSGHHRVYRALRRMVDRGEGGHAVVLYRLFGERPPNMDVETFGDLAPLASLTATGRGIARDRAETQPGLGPEAALRAALRIVLEPDGPPDVRQARRRAAEARRAGTVASIILEARALRFAAAAAYRAARGNGR